MSNQPDHILYYSARCLHSKEFLNILSKDVSLYQKFVRICVDNQGVKIPPYVKAVPAAIIPIEGQPRLLTGTAIFNWYNDTHTKMMESQSIMDWDPAGMAGYSDGFSYLENERDPLKKNFSYLNDSTTQHIYAPDDKNFGDKKKDSEKTDFDVNYENFMNQRKFDIPNAPPRL